mmetsp:Transcript_42455/g.165747  ORF Transcript_42455/g.165747 Transcript_42455/m.165747 type:complete len:792 (-) Transcript_42455:3396-5771(-)|eukprot:CAMPEP_0113960170 /NCGR_PEP_ID=MMETSP0011_2-20120614/4558_1 /TAXON_ID=101924 /ORGANISM="Rhodosorus marinus" /LENGTH=791 /DNA_ID=CAMNT_0000971577 /DNA_START=473 /DNA_END=2848 /DNA_ORIENTATION=- /assembly_acc=CAM_ASM_000156
MEISGGRGDDDRMRLEVTSMLARVGDDAEGRSSVEEQLDYVSGRLIQDASRYGGTAQYWEVVRKALILCGNELAHKVGMYSTVVALIAGVSEEGRMTAERVANGTSGLMITAIRDGQLNKALQALKFLCELCNVWVVSWEWLMETLRSLLEAAVADRRPFQLHARSQMLVDLIASALPWGARGLKRGDSDEFDSFVDELLGCLDQQLEDESAWSSGLLPSRGTLFTFRPRILRAALDDLAARGWNSGAMPRWDDGSLSSRLESGPELTLRTVQIPSHSKVSRYSPPSFICTLSSDKPEESGQNDRKRKGPIEQLLLRDTATNILDNFRQKHLEGAIKMLSLPIPMDANQEVVDATFTEMCALPSSHQPQVFYGATFMDLCRVPNSRLSIRLLKAVQLVYDKLGQLDPEVFDRLSDWLAFHLSNFSFHWNWANWAACGTAQARDRIPYKRIFCRDVLDHVCRLSYRDKIVGIVPDKLHSLIPPAVESLPARSTDEDEVKVVELISGSDRKAPPELKARLMGIYGDDQYEQILRGLFAAILRAVQAILSHFDAMMERYISVVNELIALTGREKATRVVMDELWRLWPALPLRCVTYVDKLCTYQVLNPLDVINYLLSIDGLSKEELIDKMETSGVWELMRLLMSRQRSRVQSAKADASTAARFAASATEAEADMASEKLKEAKLGVETVLEATRKMIWNAIGGLNVVHTTLSEGIEDSMEETENGAPEQKIPVWEWRVLGFCKEVIRKNTSVVEANIGDFDEFLQSGPVHAKFRETIQPLKTLALSDLTDSVI